MRVLILLTLTPSPEAWQAEGWSVTFLVEVDDTHSVNFELVYDWGAWCCAPQHTPNPCISWARSALARVRRHAAALSSVHILLADHVLDPSAWHSWASLVHCPLLKLSCAAQTALSR